MSDLYRAEILDHYRNPRNFGSLEPSDVSSEDDNSLCGDRIRIDLRLDGDTIADIRFTGSGCAISQAATSMLTELVKGRDIATVHSLTGDDIVHELGIPISPARMECALLGLNVLRAGTADHRTWERPGRA